MLRVAGGTSMAAPHVTGVAALVGSRLPALLDQPVAMRSRLLATGRGLTAAVGKTVTGRMVNALRAIDNVAPTLAPPDRFSVSLGSVVSATSFTGAVRWNAATDQMTGIASYAVKRKSPSGWSTVDSPRPTCTRARPCASARRTPSGPGHGSRRERERCRRRAVDQGVALFRWDRSRPVQRQLADRVEQHGPAVERSHLLEGGGMGDVPVHRAVRRDRRAEGSDPRQVPGVRRWHAGLDRRPATLIHEGAGGGVRQGLDGGGHAHRQARDRRLKRVDIDGFVVVR